MNENWMTNTKISRGNAIDCLRKMMIDQVDRLLELEISDEEAADNEHLFYPFWSLVSAIQAIQGPWLDEHGLAACGCGGKACDRSYSIGDSDMLYIECSSCGLSTGFHYTLEKAKEAWNKAMRYRRANEAT